jgi:hypothetical protein
MVRALEISFTNTTRLRMLRGSVWIASIALSVPWPLTSGANLAISKADSSAPPVVTSGSVHGLAQCDEPGPPPSADDDAQQEPFLQIRDISDEATHATAALIDVVFGFLAVHQWQARQGNSTGAATSVE